MRRRKLREVAAQILYGLELRPELLPHYRSTLYLDRYFSLFFQKELLEESFLKELLEGIPKRYTDIGSIIEAQSEHWRLQRMPHMDRSILRVGVYELLYCEDIPASVTINEAVELAHRLGDKGSPSFINGILDKVSKSVVPELQRQIH